jgi:hypothetical protein
VEHVEVLHGGAKIGCGVIAVDSSVPIPPKNCVVNPGLGIVLAAARGAYAKSTRLATTSKNDFRFFILATSGADET